jgi:2-isopropylmalate synthase
VRQIQGTLNGIGERCGNANLVTLIPTLKLKPAYAERFTIGVDDEALADLTQISRAFDELLNRAPNRHAPYVGEAAFATKAGIHASAILKDPRTYEHVPPGSRRQPPPRPRLRPGRQVEPRPRARPRRHLRRQGRPAPRPAARRRQGARGRRLRLRGGGRLLRTARPPGARHGAALLRRPELPGDVERRFNAVGELVTVSEAVVKVTVDGEEILSVAEGNGPINALDIALRKDLGRYQSIIQDLELVDFKVRILNGGTGATTRVLIESRDGDGDRWFTVGVSPNIVDASFQALIDSVTYKLIKEGAATANGTVAALRKSA